MRGINYPDERYVRVYSRNTIEWNMLAWQAKCLWPLVNRQADRAGVIDLGKYGAQGLADTLRMPPPVVETGLYGDGTYDGLATMGWVTITGNVLVIPDFVEAQESKQSDAQRMREYRLRAKDRTAAEQLGLNLGQSSPPNTTVTDRNGLSQIVTAPFVSEQARNENEQNVTLFRAVPFCAVPFRSDQISDPPPLAHARGENGTAKTAPTHVLTEPDPSLASPVSAPEPPPEPAPIAEAAQEPPPLDRWDMSHFRDLWMAVLGKTPTGNHECLAEAAQLCATSAELTEAAPVVEHAEKLMRAFGRWVQKLKDAKRPHPQLSVEKFVEHFAVIEDEAAGRAVVVTEGNPARAGPRPPLPLSTSVTEESRKARKW